MTREELGRELGLERRSVGGIYCHPTVFLKRELILDLPIRKGTPVSTLIGLPMTI